MSLSPQNVSRLNPPQKRYREDSGDQGDGDATRQNQWENCEAGRDRSVEVSPANPDRNAYADAKADYRSHRSQRCGLGGEESLDHSAGGAQGLHDGKVAA